jgi:hypothetical protein
MSLALKLIAMMAGNSRSIRYRAKALTVADTLVVKPSGCVAGDLVLVLVPQTSSATSMATAGGSAWTASEIQGLGPTNILSRLFWKVLNATDAANDWELNGAEDALAVRYWGNGATTVTVEDTTANGTGQNTMDLAGFTPAAGSKGVIAIIVDGDTAAGDDPPTGFTSRHEGAVHAGLNVNFTDRLTGYDGSTATFTSTQAGSSNPEHGWLIEIT